MRAARGAGLLASLLSGCSLLTFDGLMFVHDDAAVVEPTPDAEIAPPVPPVPPIVPPAPTDAGALDDDAGPLFVSRDTARAALPQCTLTARPAESMVELVRLLSADGPPCPGPSPRFPAGMVSTWAVESDCRFSHVRTLEIEGWSLRIEDEGVYSARGRAEGTMVQVSNGCEHRWEVRWVDGPCPEPPPESPWLRCVAR